MAKEPGIRERSGSEDSEDPLITFLYILMRDHMPAGEVEGIIKSHVLSMEGGDAEFSNGWLARYAKDIANRLRKEKSPDA